MYVTIQGRQDRAYAGLYSLVENPDEEFVAARGLPKTGAIFKPVATNVFADLGPDWKRYNQTYDPKTTLTALQQQRVIDFARLVTGATDAQFAAQVGDYLDLDETARYLAVVVFLSDLDGLLGPGQNYYLYLDPRTRNSRSLPGTRITRSGSSSAERSLHGSSSASITRGPNRAASSTGCFASTRSRSSTSHA